MSLSSPDSCSPHTIDNDFITPSPNYSLATNLDTATNSVPGFSSLGPFHTDYSFPSAALLPSNINPSTHHNCNLQPGGFSIHGYQNCDCLLSTAKERLSVLQRQEQKERRKSQNRAAQRAFRDRKEQQVCQLTTRVTELVEANAKLAVELESQNQTIENLEDQIRQLEKAKMFRCDDWVAFDA